MRFNKIIALLCLSFFSAVVAAAPIQIASTPTETSGPFRHNAFHTAGSSGGEVGTIIGWFDLGVGGGSWDPDTGAFVINIDIFSDDALTTGIGTAVGTGSIAAAAFNGHDGGLIGTISWDFDAAAEGNGLSDITTSFIDIDYSTSTAGHNANSLTGSYDSFALWGADGSYDTLTGVFDTNTTTTGVDFVVSFVPVPAAVWLFGSGLLGLIAVSRRKFKT